MGALATRELIVAARTPGIPLVVCATWVLLTAFAVIWSPGVAVLAPLNLYEQARALHWILLAAMLPWAAVRCSPRDQGDRGVMITAVTAMSPESIVSAKMLASLVISTCVALAGLPGLIMAQQSAAVPVSLVLIDLLPLVGLALLIAATATMAMTLTSTDTSAWLCTCLLIAVVLSIVLWWSTAFAMIGGACAAIGVAIALSTRTIAGSRFTYLGERHAA